MPTLDVEFVRRQFPAFSEPSLDGWAFFENAGGSYPCRQVVQRLDHYYRATKVQPYGSFPASREAGRQMDEAHARLAGLLNVGANEVLFGPSTSQNTYVLAHAFRSVWQEGDEIVVSNQDHEANAGVWRRLSETGIVVREWKIDPETGMLDPNGLDELLNQRTRMVAFPHCSNVVAHINPVAQITAKIHTAGAAAVVDGVSYAPHGLPDVGELGADVYFFSLYKTYGPHQGLMYVRADLLDALPNQGHYFNSDQRRKKLVPAGPDHAQVAAAAGIADYLDVVHSHHFNDDVAPAERARRVHDLFRAHEESLLAPLLELLDDDDRVRAVGPVEASIRAPTVALVPLRRKIADILDGLERRRIMAGGGDFYATRPLEALGIPVDPGVLRMSFVHYTSRAEIDWLIAALDELL